MGSRLWKSVPFVLEWRLLSCKCMKINWRLARCKAKHSCTLKDPLKGPSKVHCLGTVNRYNTSCLYQIRIRPLHLTNTVLYSTGCAVLLDFVRPCTTTYELDYSSWSIAMCHTTSWWVVQGGGWDYEVAILTYVQKNCSPEQVLKLQILVQRYISIMHISTAGVPHPLSWHTAIKKLLAGKKEIAFTYWQCLHTHL